MFERLLQGTSGNTIQYTIYFTDTVLKELICVFQH
nr:MAG TPA: hypothetical protein [Caudoviricetes sp.]